MPGSVEAVTDSLRANRVHAAPGWEGREPIAVIVARALAPWPLWLLLWETLRPDGLRGPAFTPVVATLLVASMAQRAARGADRTLRPDLLVLLLSLSFGVAFFLQVAAAFTWYGRGFEPTGPIVSVLLVWVAGVALYEVFKRVFAGEDGPPVDLAHRIDFAAHSLLFCGPWLGVVDFAGNGVPLPLLVGPLVAVRVYGGQDARMPPARPGRLAVRTALGSAAAVAMLVVLSDASFARDASPAVALTLVGIAFSCLLAAIALAARAPLAATALSGVVFEPRDGGVVLAVEGDEERVHVVPRGSGSGTGRSLSAGQVVTFLDVERVPIDAPPYRGAPKTVRARLAWLGTSEDLAGTLLARAWGWLAWSALTFAAAAWLLG